MADEPTTNTAAADAAKKNRDAQLAADKAAVEESNRQYAERAQGKPTPTQEENDRAKLGEHVTEKEDDGSGPDPTTERNQRAQGAEGRSSTAQPATTQRSSYQTRQTTAAQPGTSRPVGGSTPEK